MSSTYHYSYYKPNGYAYCRKNNPNNYYEPKRRKKVHLLVKANDILSAQYIAETHITNIFGDKVDKDTIDLTLTNVRSDDDFNHDKPEL